MQFTSLYIRYHKGMVLWLPKYIFLQIHTMFQNFLVFQGSYSRFEDVIRMINFTICTYDLLHLYIYMLSLCGFVLVYVARFILPFYTFRYTSYLLMLWHKLFSLKIEKDLFFMALSIVTHLLTKQGISVNVFLVIQILSKKQRLISSILRIFEMVKPIYYIVKIILNQMNLAMVYVRFVF